MLSTLEGGVRGGTWYALMDKVFRPENLRSSWERVRSNGGAAGVDHVSVAEFERDVGRHLDKVRGVLSDGSYRPQAVRRVHIPKPGRPGETRPLGIPTVRDRVVQGALRNVLEPIFEAGFAEHSYGFRPGKGAKDALRRVRQLIDAGFVHIVDADLKSYFDTIPHDALLARVREKVTDGSVLSLVDGFLKAGVMDGSRTDVSVLGTPQGGVISPLLANIYLDPLDHLVAGKGWEMVRYADDFVILCRTAEEACAALAVVTEWTAQAGLRLHPEKTRLVDLDSDEEGFTFLGYRFTKKWHMVGKKGRERIRERVRELTPRNSGESLEVVVVKLNRVLRGWYEYYRHARSTVMRNIDRLVRMRIRAILWKRSRHKGYPPPESHRRWPTSYFQDLGLFSLKAAWHAEVTARQRAVRPPTGEPCA
jgi:RNA-directed DNA polymerase